MKLTKKVLGAEVTAIIEATAFAKSGSLSPGTFNLYRYG